MNLFSPWRNKKTKTVLKKSEIIMWDEKRKNSEMKLKNKKSKRLVSPIADDTKVIGLYDCFDDLTQNIDTSNKEKRSKSKAKKNQIVWLADDEEVKENQHNESKIKTPSDHL